MARLAIDETDTAPETPAIGATAPMAIQQTQAEEWAAERDKLRAAAVEEWAAERDRLTQAVEVAEGERHRLHRRRDEPEKALRQAQTPQETRVAEGAAERDQLKAARHAAEAGREGPLRSGQPNGTGSPRPRR